MTPDPGLASWLQLTLTPGLGASTIRKLLRQFGLPQSVIARKHELAAYAGPEALEALHSDAVHAQVDRALRWAGERGHFIVTLADELYPRALLEIADPPSLIYARGRIELLQRNCLAIVGSRNATAQGESNAAAFAKALSDAGLTIVSGLALGIDAAAHRGGLEGTGSTIAVLGTGIDVLYPQTQCSRWPTGSPRRDCCCRSFRWEPDRPRTIFRAATASSAASPRDAWSSRQHSHPAH